MTPLAIDNLLASSGHKDFDVTLQPFYVCLGYSLRGGKGVSTALVLRHEREISIGDYLRILKEKWGSVLNYAKCSVGYLFRNVFL